MPSPTYLSPSPALLYPLFQFFFFIFALLFIFAFLPTLYLYRSCSSVSSLLVHGATHSASSLDSWILFYCMAQAGGTAQFCRRASLPHPFRLFFSGSPSMHAHLLSARLFLGFFFASYLPIWHAVKNNAQTFYISFSGGYLPTIPTFSCCWIGPATMPSGPILSQTFSHLYLQPSSYLYILTAWHGMARLPFYAIPLYILLHGMCCTCHSITTSPCPLLHSTCK